MKKTAAQAKADAEEDLYSGYNELNQNTDIIMKTVAATSKANDDPIAALAVCVCLTHRSITATLTPPN